MSAQLVLPFPRRRICEFNPRSTAVCLMATGHPLRMEGHCLPWPRPPDVRGLSDHGLWGQLWGSRGHVGFHWTQVGTSKPHVVKGHPNFNSKSL